MYQSLPPIAAAITIWGRLGLFAFSFVLGAIFIFVGIQNIKTRTAQETGKRRLTNKALGKSNTYEGSKAVMVGWIRVVCGAGAILFGILFLIFAN